MQILKLEISTVAAAASLQDWGQVGLPLSDPPCRLRGMKMAPSLEGSPEMGVWECTPGRYRRQVRSAETMHVISGEATFTPDDGAPLQLRAGDVFYFAADTVGVWDIERTMRKVYVMLAPTST